MYSARKYNFQGGRNLPEAAIAPAVRGLVTLPLEMEGEQALSSPTPAQLLGLAPSNEQPHPLWALVPPPLLSLASPLACQPKSPPPHQQSRLREPRGCWEQKLRRRFQILFFWLLREGLVRLRCFQMLGLRE